MGTLFRSSLLGLAGFVVAVVFWSGFAVPGASARFTAFIDVTVVPMDTERVVPHQTVLVRDGIIVEMGSADEVTIPVSTERIDGKGRYLMPGLADFHTHIEQETELLPYVAHGVTSVLNLGSPASVLTLRDRIGAGQLLGPTLYAGAYVDGPESNAYWTIGTPDEARRVVREIKAAGWDVIKAYNSIPLEPYLAMMEEARAQDIAVVGHGVRAPGMQGLLDAGQVMVAHAEEYLYTHFRTSGSPAHISAAVEMTREAGAFVVPNLSAYETIAHQWGNQAGFDSLLARPEVRFVPPGRVEEWKRSNPYLNRTGELFSRLSFLRNFTKALHDGGVPLLLGTDSPPISMIPGFSIYQDLEEMVDAGLTPYEALASGTRNAGLFAQRHLRERTPFGTVATGHRADLILLAENPLVDVDHVKERVGVMVRGTWFSEVALQHRLADLVASFVPEQVFLEVVRNQGIDAASKIFHEARTMNPEVYLFGEDLMNEIGYDLLYTEENPPEAIKAFLLNVEAYPASSNVYDSLGEGYMVLGDTAQAILNYHKSLELDSQNENARNMLSKLEQ